VIKLDNKRELELKEFLDKNAGLSYKDKAINWFKQNLNKIVTSEEFAQITGKNGKPISHNIRRIFELRDEFGYNIVNHKDNTFTNLNLKVDEWVLLDLEPIKENIRNRGVNKKIMMDVFSRDNYMCKICGKTIADDDPFKPNHKIKLHVGHIVPHKGEFKLIHTSSDTKLTPDDFITMCNVCNEGLKNKTFKILPILDTIKKLNINEKKEIYNYLKTLFDR